MSETRSTSSRPTVAIGAGINLWDEESAGNHSVFGDIGRGLFGGLTPEQKAYADYVNNMQAQPIEGRQPYAENYAAQATAAARPGMMTAGQQARQQAAAYLSRQGAPTGRVAATQAQISNSLAQSMAAMQASAMAQGMQAHEAYRQSEQARRDAAVSQLSGMQGTTGIVPGAAAYWSTRGVGDLIPFASGGGGYNPSSIFNGRSPYGSRQYAGQGLGFQNPDEYDESSKYW